MKRDTRGGLEDCGTGEEVEGAEDYRSEPEFMTGMHDTHVRPTAQV